MEIFRVDNDVLADEKSWLNAEIYKQENKSHTLPQSEITGFCHHTL